MEIPEHDCIMLGRKQKIVLIASSNPNSLGLSWINQEFRVCFLSYQDKRITFKLSFH